MKFDPAALLSAHGMASSHRRHLKEQDPLAPAVTRRSPPPPWEIVVQRSMPQGMSWMGLCLLLGWTRGRLYWARRQQMLSIKDASRVARAIGRPIGPFLEELSRAMPEEPLAGAARLTPGEGEVCSSCGIKHTKKQNCSVTTATKLAKARAEIAPVKRREHRKELRPDKKKYPSKHRKKGAK